MQQIDGHVMGKIVSRLFIAFMRRRIHIERDTTKSCKEGHMERKKPSVK